MPPNVLLVVFDAVRRDALEPYGAPSGSSPTVGQLARRGAALPEVYATAPWTVPSHASMFTGLMPRAAGLSRVRGAPELNPVVGGLRARLLPEVLRQAGYDTRAVSANLWLSPITGFDSGYEEFTKIDTDRHGQLHAASMRARARWLAEAARAKADDGASRVLEALDRWLSDRSERPFFWFVNLLEAHSPYLPPRPYGDVSLMDRLRAARDSRRYYTLDGIWRVCAGVDAVPVEALDRLRRLYTGAVRYMDDWLAEVLERLDRRGLLDDTLVVVCSDHGENFGEGGWLAHTFSLDERLIHVPMVVAGPGAASASMSSLAEVPRMIATAAGLSGHPWHDGPPPGFGVAQFDPPMDADDAETVEAVTKLGLGGSLDLLTTERSCAVRGDLKLVVSGGREEIYDLAADPLEVAPLTAGDPSIAHRGEELAALRSVLASPAMTTRREAASVPAAAAGSPSAEELRDLEERMKLLGYL